MREARLAAGLSLGDLAGDDVSRTFIHFVEHGRSRPSRRVLELIAERTGKPVSYFLAHDRPEGGPAAQETIGTDLTAMAARIRRYVRSRRLSKVDREAMTLIEVMVRQAAVVARAIQTRG